MDPGHCLALMEAVGALLAPSCPCLTEAPLVHRAGSRRALQAGGADLLESAALAWNTASANSSRPLPAAAVAGSPPAAGNAAQALDQLTGSPGSVAVPAAPSQAAVLDLPMSLDGGSGLPPTAAVDSAAPLEAASTPSPEGGAGGSATPVQFATQAAIVLTESNETSAAETVAEAAALAFAAGQPAAAVAFAQVGAAGHVWLLLRLPCSALFKLVLPVSPSSTALRHAPCARHHH